MAFYNPTVNGPMPQGYFIDPKTMFPDWRDYPSVSNGYDACQPRNPKPMPYYPPPGNYVSPYVPIYNPYNDPRKIGMQYVQGPQYMPVDQTNNPYYPNNYYGRCILDQTSLYVPTDYRALGAIDSFEENQAAQKITSLQAFEDHLETKKSTGKKIWDSFNQAVAKIKYYTAFIDGDSDVFSKEDFLMNPEVIKAGNKPLKNKRIFIENGIDTSPQKFKNTCQKISSRFDGLEICGIFNPPYDKILKLAEAGLNVWGNKITTSGVLTGCEIEKYLAQDPNNTVLVIAHSNGASQVKLGLQLVPEDLHHRIEVLAIAPASYLSGLYKLKNVWHLRCKGDVVPLIDIRGRRAALNCTEILEKPKRFSAHAFDNPAFQALINKKIEGFIYEKE